MVRMKVMSVSSLSCSLSIWKQEASSSNFIMGLHHLLRRFGLVHLRVVDLNILGGWNVKNVPLLQKDNQVHASKVLCNVILCNVVLCNVLLCNVVLCNVVLYTNVPFSVLQY